MVAATGGDFTLVATTCTGTLGVGATCTADVACAPQTVGAKTGALSITTTSIVAMATAQLVATAIPNDSGLLTISPTSHNFGGATVGQTSAATTFTVTNAGPTTTQALTVMAGGTAPTQFALAADTCTGATLAAAGSCTFGVAFAPTSVGPKSAAFTIAATGTAPISAPVTGTGTP